MDNLKLAQRAMGGATTVQEFRAIRDGLRGTGSAGTPEGKALMGELKEKIVTADPSCFEAIMQRVTNTLRINLD